jgi:uncharacterized membrane protein
MEKFRVLRHCTGWFFPKLLFTLVVAFVLLPIPIAVLYRIAGSPTPYWLSALLNYLMYSMLGLGILGLVSMFIIAFCAIWKRPSYDNY